MSDTTLRERAAARLERVMAESGARDPREHYREQLRALRERDASAFDQATAYFRDTLVPAVAREGSDPLREWRAYGCLLARLHAPGRTVSIDAEGRAADHDPEAGGDPLVLHLPESLRERAILVGLPADPSPAQLATYRLLVAGAQR
jgi:hypothetical protein